MNYSRKTYRYILNGRIDINKPICEYKLVSQNHFPNDTNIAVRFLLPDDMKVSQEKGSSYSHTEDTRTLEELGAEIVVKMNGRWKPSPFDISLRTTQPYLVHDIMVKNGYYISYYGYLDAARYKYFIDQYTKKCTLQTSDSEEPKINYQSYPEFDTSFKKQA